MPARLYEDGTIIEYVKTGGGGIRGGRANGSKRKTFEIGSKHKRLIRSSAIRLYLTRKHKPLFATLTFPSDIDQKTANKCFSNFTDNLKTNYGLKNYVAVKENTKRGRPHFHVILDIPFVHFKILNRAWCACFPSGMGFSPNAFTSGTRKLIYNISDVSRYITKYITKCKAAETEVKPETRQYFISRDCHALPVEIPDVLLIYLLETNAHEKFEGDYFTFYKLYDYHCLPEKILQWAEEILNKPPKIPPNKNRYNSRNNTDIIPNYQLTF